mmetsp:Transcript_33246/g.30192  ORF Transcript_33246/g.30192 Transcript_33246/m.30192 type:complete len:215 (+) Transcript_33246:982-1626(+)
MARGDILYLVIIVSVSVFMVCAGVVDGGGPFLSVSVSGLDSSATTNLVSSLSSFLMFDGLVVFDSSNDLSTVCDLDSEFFVNKLVLVVDFSDNMNKLSFLFSVNFVNLLGGSSLLSSQNHFGLVNCSSLVEPDAGTRAADEEETDNSSIERVCEIVTIGFTSSGSVILEQDRITFGFLDGGFVGLYCWLTMARLVEHSCTFTTAGKRCKTNRED